MHLFLLPEITNFTRVPLKVTRALVFKHNHGDLITYSSNHIVVYDQSQNRPRSYLSCCASCYYDLVQLR